MVVVDGGGVVNGSKKSYNLHPQDTLVIIIIIIIIINHLYAGCLQLRTRNNMYFWGM